MNNSKIQNIMARKGQDIINWSDKFLSLLNNVMFYMEFHESGKELVRLTQCDPETRDQEIADWDSKLQSLLSLAAYYSYLDGMSVDDIYSVIRAAGYEGTLHEFDEYVEQWLKRKSL